MRLRSRTCNSVVDNFPIARAARSCSADFDSRPIVNSTPYLPSVARTVSRLRVLVAANLESIWFYRGVCHHEEAKPRSRGSGVYLCLLCMSSSLTHIQQKSRVSNKYAGEPDDPHFIPSSPLIERQTLSSKQEAELKKACELMVSRIKSLDGDLPAKETVEVGNKPTKHDKHSSFTFHGPRVSITAEKKAGNEDARKSQGDWNVLLSKADKEETRKSQGDWNALLPRAGKDEARKSQGDWNALLHRAGKDEARKSQGDWDALLHRAAEPGQSAVKSDFHDPEEEALFDIRSKLEFRPKTSAAACIDYAGGETSSSSNRTSRTTPFTSAGITPGSTSNRFSQNLPDLPPESVDPVPALPNKDSLQTEGLQQSADHPVAKHENAEHPNHDQHTTRFLKPSRSLPDQSKRVSHQPKPRPDSIRNSIKEYIRPGSSQIAADRPDTARAESIRSRASSIHSQMRNSFSAIRHNFSRRASHTSGVDEYLINASRVELEMLNRPLPPLPGLDTYVEPPSRQLSDYFSRPRARTTQAQSKGTRVVSEDGTERLLTAEEEAQRREEINRAVLEKMTTGSIGSGGAGVASPAMRMSIQTKRTSGNLSSFDEAFQSSISRPVSNYSGQKLVAPQSPILERKAPIQRSKSAAQRKTNSYVPVEELSNIPALPGKEVRLSQVQTQPQQPTEPDTALLEKPAGTQAPTSTPKSPFFKRVLGKMKSK